jgi:hypothetical protein
VTADVDPPWFRPVQHRVLAMPSRAGTSPWAPGVGPVRPVWTLTSLRRFAPVVRNGLYRAIADGTIPLDRSPVLDVRQLSWAMVGTDPYWYSHLRGVYARYVPHGVRLASMVTWAAPTNRRAGLWRGSRWSPRSMGALWIWPALHPHTRWGLSVDHWVDSYQTWFAPLLGPDGGVVLDTRMLALAGEPIPLPTAMVEVLRPIVRCLSLADIPTPRQQATFRWPETSRAWLGPSPWVPGTGGRYSRARWLALLDQFPDVPVYLPGAPTLDQVPAWVRRATRAQAPCLPDGVVWPPPDARGVSLRFPQPVSRAMVAQQMRASHARRG